MTAGVRTPVPVLVICFGAAIAVAALGGSLTDIDDGYRSLNKPSWQPPDWLFGPAWTLIFACTALSAAWAWAAPVSRPSRQVVVLAFLVNAALNLGWSLLFFRLDRPDWALIEVVPLWLSIVVMIRVAGARTAGAGWLLLPYLGWVGFAAFLNYTIVDLNAPFGAR
jgi:tryptophan-rich sensory protein